MTQHSGRGRFLLASSLLTLAVSFSATAAANSCPGANAEALRWLEKMSRSGSEVSYKGVVTFQRGDQHGDDMKVMQVSHLVGQDGASELLTQLTGQGAQVERINHPLDCVHPGHKLLRLGEELEAGQCGIASQYRFQLGEGERVAGRKAVRIRIEPKDLYRYGYLMDLDRQTGLLLKAQTIGPGNVVLERFQFASLTLGDDTQSVPTAEVVHRAAHPHPGQLAVDALPASDWHLKWLPAGFTATDSPQVVVSRRTYTDGLAVFSVFLEKLPRAIREGEGVVRHGGTISYTRGLLLTGKPVLVTVIGEVPLNTARMVADSLRWTSQDAN